MTLRYSAPGVRARLVAGELIPWIEKHPRSDYVKAAYLALVPWADRDRIKAIYAEARFLTRTTGVRHVVDHIIPLCRTDVCGLTVPDNLRVITYKQNAAESNNWSERCAELFAEPEQLQFFPSR